MIETFSFFEAISSFMSKYFCTKGRARRSEYWYFFLFAIIIYLITQQMIPQLFIPRSTFTDTQISRATRYTQFIANWSFFLMLVPPYFTVTVRRLHDRGFNGWLVLPLNLMPLIALVALNIVRMIGDERMAQGRLYTEYVDFFNHLRGICLYIVTVFMAICTILFAKRGTQGANSYGPDPTKISESLNQQ